MAPPPTIDIEALLRPISPDQPAGEDLTYEGEYDELREARRADDLTPQGDWKPKGKPKVSEWDRVVSLGSKYLTRKTKDLQIAAWMTEALTHLRAFSGLRDGLRLMLGIQSQFWDSYYPQIEDNDLELRSRPFNFLNTEVFLPLVIRELPLTQMFNDRRYSFLDRKMSRETDNEVRKNPEKGDEILAELREQGKIEGKEFDSAVAQTPLPFYEELADELREAVESFSEFETDTKCRFFRQIIAGAVQDRALDPDADRAAREAIEVLDEAIAQHARELDKSAEGAISKALDRIGKAIGERITATPPSVANVGKALNDCLGLIDEILDQKRAPATGSEVEAAAPAEEEAAEAEPEEAAALEEETTSEESAEAAWEPVAETPARSTPPPKAKRPRAAGGPIADGEDARERIIEAAAYLRQNEPGSPVPYLVVRALRMGEVYGLPRPLEASGLASPSSEVRRTLRRLAAEGQWAALLEEAEGALGRPEGRAWLDAQRLAIVALSETGAPAAAEAGRGLLRALLADFPDLPQAELADGTPAANAETRAWLEDEILPASGPPSGSATPYAEAPAPLESFAPREETEAVDAPPDAWDQAIGAVQAGRMAEGLLILQHALVRAATGREKFHRTLQLTELCLMARQDRLALPLAEDLARQIDDFHLEQWEDPELIARAWGALYHCLRGSGDGTADRLPPVFARLCRLDIGRALRCDGDGAG
jgi:type VI secretion system ImpA/VasJ family protein